MYFQLEQQAEDEEIDMVLHLVEEALLAYENIPVDDYEQVLETSFWINIVCISKFQSTSLKNITLD